MLIAKDCTCLHTCYSLYRACHTPPFTKCSSFSNYNVREADHFSSVLGVDRLEPVERVKGVVLVHQLQDVGHS